MNDKRLIKIFINGFSTQLNIDSDEEEYYRRAVKILNERIDAYNHKFKLPYEEILAMVAYEFAVESVKFENKNHIDPLSTMSKISQLIKDELDSDEDE